MKVCFIKFFTYISIIFILCFLFITIFIAKINIYITVNILIEKILIQNIIFEYQ